MEFMALWGLSDFVFNVLAGKFRNTFGPGWAGLGWAGLDGCVARKTLQFRHTANIRPAVPRTLSIHLLVISTLRSDITQIGPH